MAVDIGTSEVRHVWYTIYLPQLATQALSTLKKCGAPDGSR